MSERETKLMSIYITGNKGMFKTYEDIEKFAEALKAKIEYMRKVNENYFINAFIGMSRLNLRYGNYQYSDNKKPGRNKLIIKPKLFKSAKEKCLEPWHVHILIEANPGETVGEQIADYLNEKFKNRIARKVIVDDGFFMYVMKQSERIRFVIEDRLTKNLQYNFKDIYQVRYKPFTRVQQIKLQKLQKNSQIV